MEPYRILSLDGGGIRGLLTAGILQRLETEHPFMNQVDLIAGTSTGGILALGLAAGNSPAEIADLYVEHAAAVFHDTILDDIVDLGRLVGAEYDLDNLKAALFDRFGHQTLASLPKKVLISSFDLDNEHADPAMRSWKPKFFHNYPGDDSDGDQEIVDVALRTAAAPTYFPIYQGYVDGGVVANNPAMCALAQALHPPTGGQELDQIVLLSAGTGRNPHFLEVNDGDWGLAQWARHLVTLMLEGSAGTADYQVQQALGERYLRVNPLLPEPVSLDAVDKIPLLEQLAAQEDLTGVLAWVETYF